MREVMITVRREHDLVDRLASCFVSIPGWIWKVKMGLFGGVLRGEGGLSDVLKRLNVVLSLTSRATTNNAKLVAHLL